MGRQLNVAKWRSPYLVGAIIFIVVLGIIIVGYWLPWTGFDSYTVPKSDQLEYRPYKFLWDWFSVLIAPAVIAVGGFLFARAQQENQDRNEGLRKAAEADRADKRRVAEQALAEQRAKVDRELANERLAESLLQTYLDDMANLLLEHSLAASSTGDPVRLVARVRTLTVLRRLESDKGQKEIREGDKRRKETVIRFLNEANLINITPTAVDITGADLRAINLKGLDFSDTNLARVNLTQAKLEWANLRGSDLTRARLNNSLLSHVRLGKANMRGAELRKAMLTKANMGETILKGAHMEDADLTEAHLGQADLRGAFLTRAVLVGVDLRGADLRGADLTGAILARADLRGAKGTDIEWGKAKSLKDAIMPDGTVHP